jgi:putative ubiquitin-RnfH superfamily antitoxin RatB of RatAB toxin-antitoxin module
MGIFGKVVKKPDEQALREGDRVELYRPLKIDPKQARLDRARKKG